MYMQILLRPEKFLVINIIVGSKRVCSLLLFIPIFGSKSFKSIVVLFALGHAGIRNGFINDSTSLLIMFFMQSGVLGVSFCHFYTSLLFYFVALTNFYGCHIYIRKQVCQKKMVKHWQRQWTNSATNSDALFNTTCV